MSQTFDLIVIGAGPGGYVAAIRAAQLGMNVACIEKEKALGGTCLRVGCIPSKAMLESSERYHAVLHELGEHGINVNEVELDLAKMQARKSKTVKMLTGGIDGLFRKNKVTRFLGHGRLLGGGKVVVEGKDGNEELAAPAILIATGSSVATIPGVAPDGKNIGGSTEALEYDRVPEHLVVVGAGAIGLELGSVWSRLGAKVTVLEYLDRILPGMETEIANEARKIFAKQGLNFHLGARVTGARSTKGGAEVEVDGMDAPIACDKLLLAVGRKPNTEALGLDAVGIETDRRGFIPIDHAYRTSAAGIFAVGDVVPGPMLAHKAEEEGVACVEMIATGYGHVNYDAIPSIVYTAPEVASVGKTTEELEEAGVPFKSGSFPYLANGRARAIGHTEGRAKILAHRDTDRILGAHIVGSHAGDLIAECAVAIEFGASSEDLGRAIHAHPTLSEIVKEAALATFAKPIHI